MPDPNGDLVASILAIDLGTYASSAAIVVGDQTRLVADPATGLPRWPSSIARDGIGLVIGGAAEQLRDLAPGRYVAAVRRALDTGKPVRLGDREFTSVELVTAYLSAMIIEAERVHGRPIDRLTLTVPPGYRSPDPRREQLLAATASAGFPHAELVSDVAAAVMDAAVVLALPDGALVLVCDLGATWTVALRHYRARIPVRLAEETSGAGRDVDQLLLQHLRMSLPEVLEPMLAQPGDRGARAHYQASDFVRRVKHQLSEVRQVHEALPGTGRTYQLTRVELERFAEPALRWLMASCRAVVAQANATMTEIAAVVLTGAGSRLPVARMMIHTGLGRPVWQADVPELTAVRGAARWAATSGRTVAPKRPTWRVEPLCWTIPQGQGQLVRWLVAEGQHYPAGTLIAQVRTSDDRVYDLVAEWEGVLLEHRLAPGAVITSTTVAATTRTAALLGSGRLIRRHHMRLADWLLSGDHRQLIECGLGGRYVRIRDIASGAVMAETRARPGGTGRACVNPDGQVAFLAWDNDGNFVLWDVPSGTPITRIKTPDRPSAVLVDEVRWRLAVQSGKRVQVGRYRRDTATVWDLRTGALLEEPVGEDWHRRLVEFADRSTADAFTAEAVSPDGRLRAVVLPTGLSNPASAGPVPAAVPGRENPAVSLQEAATEREISRIDGGTAGENGEPVHAARVGFSADGRHLVVNWRLTSGGSVDVWDV